MTTVIEHCDAQCNKCPIGCVTSMQAEAMDETAEWSARSHPLPHPQPSHLRLVREPIPTAPFAPGVIERHEVKRADIGLALMLGAACAVGSLIWWGLT